ncbi:MAG TPA: DUF4976 domain-containing protein [Candidatus Kaiserbacteria bacterium]|nr:DUF4976 domain-containing protein [Candidatus Kaiserbacteria bacterium]
MKKDNKIKIFIVLSFVLIVVVISFIYYILVPKRVGAGLSCNNCNLVIIAITNVSAGHMSSYGYERNTTPNIDRFSKNAFLFENAFAHTSWTLPSASSVFTSQYPYTNGIFDRKRSKLLTASTLAEILKSSGFKTAAFTGGGDYNRVYGLSKGFDMYVDSDYFATIKDRIPLAENWLKDNSKGKFFLYLQGFNTHCPYNPPKPYSELFTDGIEYPNQDINRNFCLRGFKNVSKSEDTYRTYYFQQRNIKPVDLNQKDIEYLKSQYDGEIAMTDNSVNTFLDYLKENDLLKNTVVVIYAEHGEMFNKHGRFGRAGANRGTLYDDVVHVPLIIKTPKSEVGKRVKGLVQLVDMLPTILNMLDVRFPKVNNFQGKSLLPLILDNKEVNKYVYAGSVFGRDSFYLFDTVSINESIRSKNWKLIHEVISGDKLKESWELYNISKDTQELNNLVEKNQKIFNELKGELSIWKNKVFVIKDFESINNASSSVPSDLIRESKKRGYW